MSNPSINAAIATKTAAARAELHGEFVSTNRVVDALLDLRSLAADDQIVVELIDQTLSSMPGRSVVPNTWWLESLDAIDRLGDGVGRHLDPLPG